MLSKISILMVVLFVVSSASHATEFNYHSVLKTASLEVIKDPLTSRTLAANIYWGQVEQPSLLFTFEADSNIVKLTHRGMGENQYTDITELGEVTVTFAADGQSYYLSQGKYVHVGSFIYMRKDEDFFEQMSASKTMYAQVKVFSEIYNLELDLQGVAELLEQVSIITDSGSQIARKQCEPTEDRE